MFHCARRAVPALRQAGGGSIVNIASISGLRASTLRVAYGTSKAGVIQLTKQQAAELGAVGIRVNAIAPGYVDTEMVRAVPPDVLTKIIARIPMGRLGHAEDIARGVVFLTADDGDFITGSTLSINGGQHMY